MNFGTFATETGFAYDKTQNPLLAQNVMSVTKMFGHEFWNWISNAEYATARAAVEFARVLGGSVVEIKENTTASVSATKWGIQVGEKVLNAGAIASVLGDDPSWGTGNAKDGNLAQAVWGVKYEDAPELFHGLAAKLLGAVAFLANQ